MKLHRAIVSSLTLLSLAACQQQKQEPATTLHEVMAGSIDPVADVIWHVASKAYGEDGNAKAGVLADRDWAQIAKAARDLHDGAMIIANNPDIVVAAPGAKILDEGKVAEAVTAVQVASYVERDRPGLASHARNLSAIALEIEAAAKARNAAQTVKLSEDLDEVCETCHKRFWYPAQPTPPAVATP